MEEAMEARYWCHQCSQVVTPVMEVEIKCPFCRGGFIEEMSNGSRDGAQDMDSDFQSDRALSLWAPILLGMMGNPRRRRRLRRFEFGEEDGENSDGEARRGGDMDLDRELESIIRSRRRSSATILQLLQVCRYQIPADESKLDSDRPRSSSNRRERENESNVHGHVSGEEESAGDGRSGRRFSFPWPFNGLFASGSQSSRGNSSSSTSGNTSQTDEN
ncbi:BCA2 zinc finger ATL 4 [Hibiscus trionum]|uniref:RING-type E3 ubiquitin transferase n=1 Tax=Hibiscus trionum TaxID=183268 RepID=A0A9W7J283_HIBTR|nr:BCA2 zinc finger ATL 4 [Hibiscus trionum]